MKVNYKKFCNFVYHQRIFLRCSVLFVIFVKSQIANKFAIRNSESQSRSFVISLSPFAQGQSYLKVFSFTIVRNVRVSNRKTSRCTRRKQENDYLPFRIDNIIQQKRRRCSNRASKYKCPITRIIENLHTSTCTRIHFIIMYRCTNHKLQ